MSTPATPRGPFRAWAASLPIALGVPLLCWAVGLFIGKLISNGQPSSDILSLLGALVGFTLFIALYSIPIHLVCYLVTGLPIFLISYKNPQSIIWKPAVAIPAGIILANTAIGISVLIDVLNEPGVFRAENFYFLLIGSAYGFITAIAAYRQRPIIS